VVISSAQLLLRTALGAEGGAHRKLIYETVVKSRALPQAGETQQTHEISQERLRAKSARSLTDALTQEAGVQIQTNCANCGAKRVVLGGLRGEHTTLLVDGFPVHTSGAALYGLDALPMAGVERIELGRGTGAAQLAPEAIGGVVNVITQRARGRDFSLIAEEGEAGVRYFSGVGTWVSPNAGTRVVSAFQLNRVGAWDLDKNRVAEFPDSETLSGFLKISQDLARDLELEARVGAQTLDTLGGNTSGFRPTGPRNFFTTNSDFYFKLFPEGDTRRKFFGDPSYITDSVRLDRVEGALSLTKTFDEGSKIRARFASSRQEQDAIYMHGYDYRNQDELYFGDLQGTYAFGEHRLLLGAEGRKQRMDSQSRKLYQLGGLTSDSFRFESAALVSQGIFSLTESSDLSLALRMDQFSVKWVDRPSGQNTLDRSLISPRLHYRNAWDLGGSELSSSLGYGRGYRVPLTFFESQHGLSERGFRIGITDLETSHNFSGSLAWEGESQTTRVQGHRTYLSDMAYAEQDVPIGEPVIFQNVKETFQITSWDVSQRWHLFHSETLGELDLEWGYEQLHFPDGYTVRLPAANVEQRARILLDYHVGRWEAHLSVWGVGARDLARYRYGNRFHALSFTPDPLDPEDLTFSEVVGRDPKSTRVPAYATMDVSVERAMSSQWKLKLSVLNLFNTTQTGMGSSPLNWNQHGTNPEHFHLDNNFLWGPLRGRVLSIQARADF
jgi:outer membrane receptor protein involved in Fe transport